MNYATESDDHVRKTVRSLRRTLGLLTILAVEVTVVYALPPETCDLDASTAVRCDASTLSGDESVLVPLWSPASTLGSASCRTTGQIS